MRVCVWMALLSLLMQAHNHQSKSKAKAKALLTLIYSKGIQAVCKEVPLSLSLLLSLSLSSPLFVHMCGCTIYIPLQL